MLVKYTNYSPCIILTYIIKIFINISLKAKYFALCLIGLFLIYIVSLSTLRTEPANAQKTGQDPIQYVGVNVRGYYTSLQGLRYATAFPDHYYDDSFKLISHGSMNHIRYVFYWEAYEKNPS